MSTPFLHLRRTITRVELNLRDGLFLPQNEIDFNGYLFHTWLSLYPNDKEYLHLEARVKNYKQSRKHYRGHADLAYGRSGENPRRREWIDEPNVIVESKSFRGFTPNQRNIRRGRLKEDISALGAARLEGDVTRVVVVLDNRRKPLERRFIREIRNLARKQKNKVHLYVVS